MSLKKSKSLLKIIDKNTSDEDLKIMMRWRIKNQKYYAEQIKITFKSFKWWFKEHYLNKRRILFWVVNGHGEKIGHMGLFEMRGNSVKIDNVLRGEKKSKGIMGRALKELLYIAERMFKNIYLKVKIDNLHAIEFYKRHGFIPKYKVRHRGVLSLKMKYERL